MKGNAIDLAVGVIVGAAFTGIVNSLVKDVMMPSHRLLTGGLDFSNKFVILRAAKDGSTAFQHSRGRSAKPERLLGIMETLSPLRLTSSLWRVHLPACSRDQ